MELQSVNFFLQTQDGGIQDGCIELKNGYILTQPRKGVC